MARTVLLTGITGFLGTHIAAQLLQEGYRVRGSLRTPARSAEVVAALEAAGAPVDELEFVQLDLLRDAGWADAAAGCEAVLHVASPFITGTPKHPSDLIDPAVQGTRRAVSAALEADVERLVVTSSIAAVMQPSGPLPPVLGAEHMTDPEGRGVTSYSASKVLAEREAWDLARAAGAQDRLTVINPGTVLGPLLSEDAGTSAEIIARLMRGELPMLPDLQLPWVDVADVADAHVAALLSDEAAGTRVPLSSDTISLAEIGRGLREALPAAARKVPRRTLPTPLARTVGQVVGDLRTNKAFLGVPRRFDQAPAQQLLGRPLRPIPEAVEATARSLVERGLV